MLLAVSLGVADEVALGAEADGVADDEALAAPEGVTEDEVAALRVAELAGLSPVDVVP